MFSEMTTALGDIENIVYSQKLQLNIWKHWRNIKHLIDSKTVVLKFTSRSQFFANEELQLTILFLNINTNVICRDNGYSLRKIVFFSGVSFVSLLIQFLCLRRLLVVKLVLFFDRRWLLIQFSEINIKF